MNRRGFLGAMLGAMAAPAIVRAESLMKIVVPRKEIILPNAINFGAMVWRPELTLVLPTNRLNRGDIIVTPAFRRYVEMDLPPFDLMRV